MFTHLSNLVQVVEDRVISEKHEDSKKARQSMAFPIPNLRRRTSVANLNSRHSNDVRSLYNGTTNRSVCGMVN